VFVRTELRQIKRGLCTLPNRLSQSLIFIRNEVGEVLITCCLNIFPVYVSNIIVNKIINNFYARFLYVNVECLRWIWILTTPSLHKRHNIRFLTLSLNYGFP
jgi:hypothetical protein